ncbi:MAG: hypothetical protein ABIB55_01885 [Candidatus Nealsonbacteria bacterium]
MMSLEKIRNLPERTRKIILWIIVIISALIMLFFWIGSVSKRVGQLDLPKIEIPEIKTNAQEATQIQED